MADTTAAEVATVTLTADTNHSIELTGSGRTVELTHHGDATEAVYYNSYSDEPVDELTGGGAEEERVLLAGERLVVGSRRAAGDSVFFELFSAGTPTVTLELFQNN